MSPRSNEKKAREKNRCKFYLKLSSNGNVVIYLEKTRFQNGTDSHTDVSQLTVYFCLCFCVTVSFKQNKLRFTNKLLVCTNKLRFLLASIYNCVCRNDEGANWTIVELQGVLKTREEISLEGQVIGDLHFDTMVRKQDRNEFRTYGLVKFSLK